MHPIKFKCLNTVLSACTLHRSDAQCIVVSICSGHSKSCSGKRVNDVIMICIIFFEKNIYVHKTNLQKSHTYKTKHTI